MYLLDINAIKGQNGINVKIHTSANDSMAYMHRVTNSTRRDLIKKKLENTNIYTKALEQKNEIVGNIPGKKFHIYI